MPFFTYLPTLTLFGAGQLNTLATQPLPGKKALVVVSNGKSTKANGSLARLEEQLRNAGVETVLFDQVEPNPLRTTVMAGSALSRLHNCDFIVALGGGSCIDAAKAIAVVATNPGDIWDYVAAGTGKAQPIAVAPLPLVAIPTTAGTGSEADAGAVITNADTKEKVGIGDLRLFPRIAIIDPELMVTVPPLFTAFQGFDAFFHSAEGFIANRANPMSDMVGLTAMENVSRYLARAVRDGSDLEAREKVAFGAYLSGIEMVVGSTSSQHSLEHALSAYHQDLPHGAGLILLSKAYFGHFIAKQACDERFVKMAQVMGMEGAKDPQDFLTALDKMQRECGVADLKMSDYGISPDEFEAMARNARATMGRLFLVDRVPLTHEDCVAIYRAAYR